MNNIVIAVRIFEFEELFFNFIYLLFFEQHHFLLAGQSLKDLLILTDLKNHIERLHHDAEVVYHFHSYIGSEHQR